MANPNLGKMLRSYRKSCNYSVKNVMTYLAEDFDINVTDKAIYSWENGQNQPPADTLLALCKIYHISNILESLGYISANSEVPLLLSSEEKELITKFRTHKYFNAVVKKLIEIEE